MSKFKTAAELGLEEKHYCALVKTMDALERGLIRHVSEEQLAGWLGDRPGLLKMPDCFNMGSWHDTYKSCGTVCCIGGSAELIGGLPGNTLNDLADDLVALNKGYGLYELFYPYNGPSNWDAIKPHHAAQALRNYLTHGEPRWTDAMKAKPRRSTGSTKTG